MADLEKIKSKAKEIAGVAVDKSTDLYKTVEEKAKIYAKVTKLKGEIAAEKVKIRKLYFAIGKKYYAAHKESTEAQLTEEVTAISEAFAKIDELVAEIETLNPPKPKTVIDIDIVIRKEEPETPAAEESTETPGENG